MKKTALFLIAYLGCLILRIWLKVGRLETWRREEIMGILMEFEEKSKSGRARFFWLGVYRLAVFIVVGLALVFMALLNYVSGHYYGIGSAVALAVLLVLVMRREDAHGS